MAVVTKQKLSGSTNGRGISVATTSTAVHTATATADQWDEVWLYAMNSSTAAVKLTLEWGSAAAPDLIEVTIAPEDGLVLVCPGLIAGGGIAITALAATGAVIELFGFVNRVTN